MGNQFDYKKMDYVEFEFNSPRALDTPAGEKLAQAWLLHDEYISDVFGELSMESFSDGILTATEICASNSDIEDVRVEKGTSEPGNLGIKVYSGDEYLGEARLDVWVMADRYIEGLLDQGMSLEDVDIPNLPNGDPITEMDNYTWEDFDKLEQMAQAEVGAEFSSAVSNIEGPDGGLNK